MSLSLPAMTAGLRKPAVHAGRPQLPRRRLAHTAERPRLRVLPVPNNRQLVGSAPPERSGAGAGMLATVRLTGQTIGSALVALSFCLTGARAGAAVTHGTTLALGIGTTRAFSAMVVSALRLRV